MLMMNRYGCLLVLVMLLPGGWLRAQSARPWQAIDREVNRLMQEGDIPGLSLVVVCDTISVTRHYGYAWPAQKKRPTDSTLYEIGSVSKSFTALAVMHLAESGALSLTDPVRKHIPWLTFTLAGQTPAVTVGHLLHHTSGIPWHTLARIPEGNGDDALQQTVRAVAGQELRHTPGTAFEYASINYDIMGLVIQRVSGMTYEQYIRRHLLVPLGMRESFAGYERDNLPLAQGHKVSFFRAVPYRAPVYRGNTPAGYFIVSPRDMARWLRAQMDPGRTPLDKAIRATHRRNEQVAPNPHSMASYAGGWNVSLKGDGLIFHEGLNPNYTSFAGWRGKTGVVVLANASSSATTAVGLNVLRLLNGEPVHIEKQPLNGQDALFSVMTALLGVYVLTLFLFVGWRLVLWRRGQARWRVPGPRQLLKWGLVLILLAPLLAAVYLLPQALARFNWAAALVWTPQSFATMTLLWVAAIGMSYGVYIFGSLLADRNAYRGVMPRILLLSVVSGLANTVLVILVTNAVGQEENLAYVLFYFGLIFGLYILCRKAVQTHLTRLTGNLVSDLRRYMLRKVFATSYQDFEQLERGQVYTTLNDDTNQVSNAANVAVSLVSNVVTVLGAFLFLCTIAFWAAALTIGVILLISLLYYLMTQKSNALFEEARSASSRYMDYLNGMIDGFKELSMHRQKRFGYKQNIEAASDILQENLVTARIRFINAFLVGESLLITVLALVAFALARIFPDIAYSTLMSFVVILLYLIGPINAITGGVPVCLQMRVSWKRIQKFLATIRANPALEQPAGNPAAVPPTVEEFTVSNVHFGYSGTDGEGSFKAGPISFTARSGEIIFLTGGNGSGKTTIAKMLTGLYQVHGGQLLIDGKAIGAPEVGEYFSVAFNPAHLFPRLYGVDCGAAEAIAHYLALLDLDGKVRVEDGNFSTTNLSSGQRKRLALLQAYLEDKPILLLDEWASEQDPEYRRVFYRQLLPELRRRGKIVIAITHDDHYYDVADRIIKLHQGKIDSTTTVAAAVTA
jgi:cyclic peptide transporter